MVLVIIGCLFGLAIAAYLIWAGATQFGSKPLTTAGKARLIERYEAKEAAKAAELERVQAELDRRAAERAAS